MSKSSVVHLAVFKLEVLELLLALLSSACSIYYLDNSYSNYGSPSSGTGSKHRPFKATLST